MRFATNGYTHRACFTFVSFVSVDFILCHAYTIAYTTHRVLLKLSATADYIPGSWSNCGEANW